MLERKMMHKLRAWKSSRERKVFVLLGARQTGKTHAIRRFACESYKSFVEVNFLDRRDNAAFLSESDGAEELISRLSLIEGRALPEGSLIFLDEVQHVGADVVTLSKFVVEDGRYDLVLSGSPLGTVLDGVTSFPVGYAQIERMYPLDFEEFCWAVGVPDAIVDQIHSAYRRKAPVGEALHERMTKVFRQYIAVGGMPEAVLEWVTTEDVLNVREIQNRILASYTNDISKHAGNDTERVRMVWNSIPAQLAKENKKFVYGAVRKGGRAKDFEVAIQWLVDAGLTYKIHRCNSPEQPLKFYEDFDAFKLYLLDVGLLGALSEVSAGRMLVNNDVFKEFKGAFTENYVLEQLIVSEHPVIYYFSKENSKVEVDFLVQTRGRVIPI